MNKLFSFVLLLMAMIVVTSCSSQKGEKAASGSENPALDNIFARKSVRAYLDKGYLFGYPATKEQPKQKFDEKKIHYNQY